MYNSISIEELNQTKYHKLQERIVLKDWLLPMDAHNKGLNKKAGIFFEQCIMHLRFLNGALCICDKENEWMINFTCLPSDHLKMMQMTLSEEMCRICC